MATASVINTPKSSSKPPQSSNSSKVRVVVRVRPFLPSEILSKSGNPISCASVLNQDLVSGDEVAVILKDQETSRKECYKLDGFFGQDGSATQIFHKEVSTLIPGIFHGCNSTVFAYGATGSGKTHTMQGTDELPGIMPLAMSMILSLCENSKSSCEISYYEVYMDKCYDLLERKAKEISILDDKDGQVQLRGLSKVSVGLTSEFHEILSLGIQRRKVAHTGLNDVSSRSHGVLVVTVSTPSSDGSRAIITGKLNLIDLAGNEDNRKTCNEGIRLQESAKINQSLFALSNVIYALNNNKERVPYRESKLTRILQDSLGGNSCALMVACLNPGKYQESLNTVRLASRSRQLRNYISSAHKEGTPEAKVDMEAKLRTWLESKGKTKGAERSGALVSLAMRKTPFSTKSVKKQNLSLTFEKAMTITDAEARIFSGAPNPCTEEEKCTDDGTHISAEVCEAETCTERKDVPSSIGVISQDAVVEDTFVSEDACEKIPKYDSSTNQWASLFDEDGHFISYDKNGFDDSENVEDDKTASGVPDNVESVIPFSASQPKGLDESEEVKEDTSAIGVPSNKEAVASESDESLNKENPACTPSNNKSVRTTPLSEKIKVLQQSIRKVLSPINNNSNTRIFEDLPSKDPMCVVFFEPKTPKTPYILRCTGEGVRGTPLDKLNSRSSNLKTSLVQEYLDFLNSASREELLSFKGIGQKRAESILHLREKNPLKSLYDLEKIGLSTKQVNDIFRTAAREIFD